MLCESVANVYGVCQRRFKLLAAIIFLSIPSVLTAEPVVIAALGDSLTQGYGLARKDGLVTQLEDWLILQGEDVRILNAGVSGDTTAGGRARIDWTLTPDVQALIVILGGNDMLRGIDPATSRANMVAILDVAVRRKLPVMLVGMPAPGNFGPNYKAEFDALYPELAKEYGTLFVANFFTPLLEGSAKIPARKYMQADGIHPNAAGVREIVGMIAPVVQSLIMLARNQKNQLDF
ncbi:MAG: arylesterase [Marinosulfonomonas sp.]|nr:arylesterase [Marinosulfonomonas sp.]